MEVNSGRVLQKSPRDRSNIWTVQEANVAAIAGGWGVEKEVHLSVSQSPLVLPSSGYFYRFVSQTETVSLTDLELTRQFQQRESVLISPCTRPGLFPREYLFDLLNFTC